MEEDFSLIILLI